MSHDTRRVVIQTDPDFGETLLGAFKLVEDAYVRGTISCSRRRELLDLLATGAAGLFEACEYLKPHPDPNTIGIGVFLEPTAAFLSEIGLAEPSPLSSGQAAREAELTRREASRAGTRMPRRSSVR
jgi:hypothetical protein